MGKLVEYDHLSIDGRFFGDDFWAAQMKVAPNDNHFAYQLRLLEQAAGLVLGRATYQTFAATWPTMTGDMAATISSPPKRAPSPPLTETTWNAEVLPGNAIDAIAQLKESGKGTLVKYGNGSLSRALIEAGCAGGVHREYLP